MNKEFTLLSMLGLLVSYNMYYNKSQALHIKRSLLLIMSTFVLVNLTLVNVTGAITADIGCQNTYHKNSVVLDKTQKYTQFAFRWNCSQEVQINRIGLYRFWTSGLGGPYDYKIVNDNNGVPGSTVYAQNLSYSEHGSWDRIYMIVNLNTTFKLPKDTPCWIVVDGRNVSSADPISFSTFDRELRDKSYGFDYCRWSTAGWGGTKWIAPALSGSNYPMYGSVCVYNNNTILGDGQFAINEDTHFIYADHYSGQKITNAPSDVFQINRMMVRIISLGNYGNVYFTVLDSNLKEIANRSITPCDGGSWNKSIYNFTPPISVGAGNTTIYTMLKAPQGTNSSNGLQIRAIEYVSKETSYPNGERITTGDGGYSNIWNGISHMDTMMNFTITYGTTKDGTTKDGTTKDFYVSPSGNNSNEGNLSSPWQTLAYASKQIEDGAILHVMDGTYSGDTFTCNTSNIIVSAYSGVPTVTGGVNSILGTSLSNITIDGLTFKGQSAASIYLLNCSNVTVSNCTIRDGMDGIRYRACNNSLIQNNFITNMSEHGIHIFNQGLTPVYVKNDIVGNNVSDCGHNLIDFHSNTSKSVIAGNDIYFTDSWTGNKNNTGMFIHNGNTPYLVIENNRIHHMGRLLEINNVNDCIIRNNNFYDGLDWGTSSDSRILIEAENGTVPCSPFGSNNLTFTENTYNGIDYPIMFYSYAVNNSAFTNLIFRNNTYTNVGIANLRKATSKPTKNIVFRDEKFTNFTIAWNGNTIQNGDLKFENTSLSSIYSDSINNYSIFDGVVSLGIDSNTTDIWYGDIVAAPIQPILCIANFSANITSGSAPLNVSFIDTSTGAPGAWNWSFGDKTYSIEKNPTHKYLSSGNYTVSVTVSNDAGSDKTTKPDYIKVTAVPQKPVANFKSNITFGNAPLNVAFTDTSTGTPVAWNWSFGDGTYSTNNNTTHIYYTNGSYNVSLTISDSNGTYTEKKEGYINVLKSPTINQTANISFGHSDFSINVNSTKDLHILAKELPDGLSGYNITAEFSEPKIIEIEAVSFPDWATFNESSSCPSDSIWMSAVDLESNVNPEDKYVLLGTITVRAKGVGTANMTISVTNMDGDEGTLISPKIVVRSLVPFTGCTKLPTDPDGDGLYEDINGNNRVDFDDISVYHKNIDWIPEHQPPRFFDYNLNGRIDSNDVIRLYKEMKG